MRNAAVRYLPEMTPEQERFLSSRVFRSLLLNRTRLWRDCTRLLLDMHADPYWSPGRGAILDIGCGLGTFCNLAARAFPSERVVGIETDLDCVYAARAHVHGRVQIRQTQGNDNLLDFPSKSFSWVTSMHSLTQVENPDLMLGEIARVLAPDGIATFVVANVYYQLGMMPWNTLFGTKPHDSTIKHFWGSRFFQQMLGMHGLHSIAYPFGDKLPLLPGIRSWFIVNAWKEGCYGSVRTPGNRFGGGAGCAGRATVPGIVRGKDAAV
jgi:ubiquinone/menaquinone biosynthesis C-methylase UbiE